MQYTTPKIEAARADLVRAEQRTLNQRRRVEKLLIERSPADEAQARLLVMEQSLLAMARFLAVLEHDLETGARHPRVAPAAEPPLAAGGAAPLPRV